MRTRIEPGLTFVRSEQFTCTELSEKPKASISPPMAQGHWQILLNISRTSCITEKSHLITQGEGGGLGSAPGPLRPEQMLC